MDHIRKKTWQEFARSLEHYRLENDSSVSDLCDEFGYSRGKISIYLNLAAALKHYPELNSTKKLSEAILFIRKKKFHRSLEC